MIIFNASPGFGSPLTENEVINFLTSGKLNIHIGTLDNKGEPNIHPTWYYFDNTNRFYIETSKQSKKTENLRTTKKIYYCVDVHEDINHNIPVAEKIMIKYLGNLEHPMAKALMTSVKSGDSVILEVSPSYYSTWDYSKRR